MLDKKIRGYKVKELLICYALIAVGFVFAYLGQAKVVMSAAIGAAILGVPVMVLIGKKKE